MATQDTLFDSPDETPEHAVIARFQLGGDDFGEPDQRSLVFEAKRSIEATVATAAVGEFGGGELVIYAYGPDAEALFRVMEPGCGDSVSAGTRRAALWGAR